MSRHVAIAAALAATGVMAGHMFLVRPADRRTRATYQQIADLNPLVAAAPEHNARLVDLGHALDDLSGQVRNICRPGSGHDEGERALDAIHRAIFAPGARIRGVRARSTAGPDGGGGGPWAVPLTVDLDGSFEVIFEVLRRIEAIPHRVQVTSVSMNVPDEETHDRSPMLTATIDLDLLSARAPLEYPR